MLLQVYIGIMSCHEDIRDVFQTFIDFYIDRRSSELLKLSVSQNKQLRLMDEIQTTSEIFQEKKIKSINHDEMSKTSDLNVHDITTVNLIDVRFGL